MKINLRDLENVLNMNLRASVFLISVSLGNGYGGSLWHASKKMFSSSSRLSEVFDEDDGYTLAANTSNNAMKSLNRRLILALYPPSSVLLAPPHFFSLATLAISSSIIVTVNFLDTI